MEDDKIQLMYWKAIIMVLVLAMTGLNSDGAICPAACRCENDILTTSCSSANLEFVPIQLNPELHELDLSNNKISQIHFSFPFYEKLVTLNLSRNRIKTLGNNNFESQINLTHLDLSTNQIENITKDSLKGLKALTYLDLSRNNLGELQEPAFRELHSLIVLKLRENKLAHLEEGLFVSVKNLRELYLNDNQFLEVPTNCLVDTVNLNYLSLSKNYIREVEDGKVPTLPELHTLLLDDNLITNIHSGGLSSLVALDYLDLSNNNLKIIPTESLSKLSSLSILKLSGNFISDIPPVAFRGLFHLKILHIDRLETLKKIDARAFVDNINLEKVNLNYNIGISKLPTRLFHGNPKITSLCVRYNSLQTIEAIHFPLDQLRELNLGGNPLQCNCSLGWLWQLSQEYKSKPSKSNSTNKDQNAKFTNYDLLLDVDDIKCDGPVELKEALLSNVTKSQMDCSNGWMAIVSVTLTVLFIIIVIGGVVYWAPKRKSKLSTKDLSIHESLQNLPSTNINKKSELYETAQAEKYILPNPIIIHNEYHSLPSWDPYGESSVNIYEQLNFNRDRPHIVYV
ncbi:uncharacterized protein [Diabrotica undecimpunctata]|uniref:uncharacterized protein n=1 Tax=Diabrotica undecimpunctata TaxID=50387 RepID=UPI003B63C77F